MNRRITNVVRFMMDELLPPILRDARWFMYPFFWIAYRGKNVREAMDFKRDVYGYSRRQYADFYSGIDSISRHRKTDLNQGCIDAILAAIESGDASLADIGCGNGYLLSEIRRARPAMKLTGVDVTDRPDALAADVDFVQCDIHDLDLAANAYDVVTCCHVLEHLIDYRSTLRKLVAAARRAVIFVVPLQRPYRYTLDEHVNFFQFPEQFAHEVGLERHLWRRIDGDLFYVGFKP